MSHYYQPDAPMELREAAIDDWVEALIPFPQADIERACEDYIRNQPRRRPTPAEIRTRAQTKARVQRPPVGSQGGDRSTLSHDELHLLDTKILPTARDWVRNIPGLRGHGENTLAYWGEKSPSAEDAA